MRTFSKLYNTERKCLSRSSPKKKTCQFAYSADDQLKAAKQGGDNRSITKQMTTALRGCKVTLVTFAWLFSTVWFWSQAEKRQWPSTEKTTFPVLRLLCLGFQAFHWQEGEGSRNRYRPVWTGGYNGSWNRYRPIDLEIGVDQWGTMDLSRANSARSNCRIGSFVFMLGTCPLPSSNSRTNGPSLVASQKALLTKTPVFPQCWKLYC